MTISFKQIPASIAVPGTYAEFDSTRARTTSGSKRYVNLVFGQMSSEFAHSTVNSNVNQPLTSALRVATARPNIAYQVTNAAQAGTLFGQGSPIHHQAITHFKTNARVEAYFCGQLLETGGTKRVIVADYNISYPVAANKAGVERVYINEAEYRLTVSLGNDALFIAIYLKDLINADKNRLFDATQSNGILTLTARETGELYNDIQVSAQYYTNDVTASPMGLFTGFISTPAVGNPSLATAISNLQNMYFTHVVCPYNDDLNAGLILAEAQSRWSPLPNETSLGNGQEDYVVFGAFRGDEAQLNNFMQNRNSEYRTILAVEPNKTIDNIYYPGLMSASFQAATAYAATSSNLVDVVANKPHQNIVMSALKSAAMPVRFSWNERNRMILNYGLATYNYNQDSQVMLQAAITERTLTDSGAVSDGERRVETQFTKSFFRWSLRNMLELQFPSNRLADDGTVGLPSDVATPSILKGAIISLGRDWVSLGLVEDFDQFVKDLIVERSTTDCDTINIYMLPNLVNILSVKAVGIGYIVC
jgi:phage tail sheath gpL-like